MSAQETIGTVLGAAAPRDAIHFALYAVTAKKAVKPSMWVKFANDSATEVVASNREDAVGMIDPFLPVPVATGEKCWMFLKPNTVTSLRHVWEHPAFGDAPAESTKFTQFVFDPTAESRKWIEDFAASMDQTYNRLMGAAEYWVDCGEYTYDNTEAYKSVWEQFPEFWKHYEIVTATKVEDHEASFFTCSC